MTKVKTGLKAGKLATNHNRALLKVRTGLRGGGASLNHARTML